MMMQKSGNLWHILVKKVIKTLLKLGQNKTLLPVSCSLLKCTYMYARAYTEITVKLLKYTLKWILVRLTALGYVFGGVRLFVLLSVCP